MEGPKITIVSGGTATNELVLLFLSITSSVTYVLPILDNGGSTSELIRVIGGPAIGDIRLRLTRLIPPHQDAYRQLFSFRLSVDPEEAKRQWNQIVEGSHPLWAPIDPASREIFRSFLIHVHVELLKRSKHQFMQHSSSKQFRYELANVGNLFLTGVRLFIGSLDSAVELFIKLTGIDPSIKVLPCVNTNFSYHISALLENGLVITGQSQISHPSAPVHSNYPPPIRVSRPATPLDGAASQDYFSELSKPNHNHELISDLLSDEEESGSVPQYTHPELKKSQLHFDKSENITPLLSPIKRIYYISPYGQEICPTAPNRVTTNFSSSDAIIYSIGSLMTSIVPVLILKGVGRAIAASKKKKILLLNGNHDRETFGMTAVDFVSTIVKLATYSLNENPTISQEWSSYVTHLVHLTDLEIEVDEDALSSKGIVCIRVQRQHGTDYYDMQDLLEKLLSLIK